MTKKQQAIKDRRTFVVDAYTGLPKTESVSEHVAIWAKKFKVTEITIYADIRLHTGGSKRIKKQQP